METDRSGNSEKVEKVKTNHANCDGDCVKMIYEFNKIFSATGGVGEGWGGGI